MLGQQRASNINRLANKTRHFSNRCGNVKKHIFGITILLGVIAFLVLFITIAMIYNLIFMPKAQFFKPGHFNLTVFIVNQNCSGSLIKDDWILTAAHCVMNVTEPITVTAKINGTNFERISRNVHIYDDYNTHSVLANDIALIQLSKPFTSKDGFTITQLAKKPIEPSKPVMVMGWSKYSQSNNIESLRGINTPIIKNCDTFLQKNLNHENKSNRIICISKTLIDYISAKISGGPVLQYSYDSKSIVQVGIIPEQKFLKVLTLKDNNLPELILNVVFYTDWIKRTINF